MNGKIFSGAGNDTITNWSSNVTIDGGEGNDSINTYADNVTVAGNAGNDTIHISGNSVTFKYSAGDGNDFIEGFNSTSILQIASGKIDSALSNGTDAVLQIGNGIITLKGLYSRDTIKVRNGNGAVEEFVIPTAVTKTEGNDNISNLKSNVTVLGLGGNDDIYNSGSNVTIDGGAGNDSINNDGGDFVIVSGNTGDDLLINGGYWSNMHGGAGDDTLTGNSGSDTFVYESGNDVITNYRGEDTVSVKDSSGKTSMQIYGTGYSGADVMKKFVQSMANSKLTSAAKVDAAIKACSHFNSVQDVVDHLISDRKKAGDAETFLQDYCGIFLDDTDTGAVTGWDAGGLTVKTKDDLLPTNYRNTYPISTSFTKRGLTLTVPAKSTLTETEQSVVQKIYAADMEDSLKLIEDTYGFKFTNKPLTIPLSFTYQPGASGLAWAGVTGLIVNMAKGGESPDYYLPHELTHVMQQHFGVWDNMTDFMIEGMADVTADGDVRDTLALAKDITKLAKYINPNSTSSNDDNYTAGVIFWHYLMRQASDNYGGTTSTPTFFSTPTTSTDTSDSYGKRSVTSLTGKTANNIFIATRFNVSGNKFDEK